MTAMVTKRMLEILGSVARMPSGYRRIRKNELKQDYEKHLQESTVALDTFYVLIEEKNEEDLCGESLACYESVMESVSAKPVA